MELPLALVIRVLYLACQAAGVVLLLPLYIAVLGKDAWGHWRRLYRLKCEAEAAGKAESAAEWAEVERIKSIALAFEEAERTIDSSDVASIEALIALRDLVDQA